MLTIAPYTPSTHLLITKLAHFTNNEEKRENIQHFLKMMLIFNSKYIIMGTVTFNNKIP